MRLAILAAAGVSVALARPAGAQVSSVVDVRDGHGSAVVRNGSASPITVNVALWESDEASKPIRLVRKARANLWPLSFELPPGTSQVVRISIEPGTYPPDTLLRLEARMVPVHASPVAGSEGESRARVILATRVLSKVIVRRDPSSRSPRW